MGRKTRPMISVVDKRYRHKYIKYGHDGSVTYGGDLPKTNTTYKGRALFGVTPSRFNYMHGTKVIDFKLNTNVSSNHYVQASLEEHLTFLVLRGDIERGFGYKAKITMRNYKWWIKITQKIKL